MHCFRRLPTMLLYFYILCSKSQQFFKKYGKNVFIRRNVLCDSESFNGCNNYFKKYYIFKFQGLNLFYHNTIIYLHQDYSYIVFFFILQDGSGRLYIICFTVYRYCSTHSSNVVTLQGIIYDTTLVLYDLKWLLTIIF